MPAADVLVVGAGPAGAACAETLRDEGFEGSIVVVGREPDPPYERPPASKSYLAGSTSRDACLLHPPEFWADRGIDLRLRTSVMKLDPAARVVKLSAGGELEFGRALLATGSLVRRLRVDGSGLLGIHYLRTLGNADAIRDEAAGVEDVVLVGGSYIACEVAATLTALGSRCTMVMDEEAPLSIGFGPRAGAWFADLLRSRGVGLVTSDPLAAFEGSGDRVEAVVTQSGRRVPARVVVMGTGALPDVMLARSAGLRLGATGGVACDATLRTSADSVRAAGDMCEYESVLHGGPARIEHWELARAHGAHAARAMLGSEEPFAEVPYFWSDLADWASLEYVGLGGGHDRVEGEASGDAFGLRYFAGERLVGCLSVNGGGDLRGARADLATAAGRS